MPKTATSMNIKPLFSNILIKPLEAETKTSSGIILPDSVKEKPQVGLVMEVGPGEVDDGKIVAGSMHVKVGDKVMYKKWGGNEIKVGNEDWTIVEQKDILAIVS
jgi:chaperonin GroES